MGEDAVSAMKNWASRLENEEASSRNWYKDWGVLITGNPDDREGEKVNGRIDTIQKQIDELEARSERSLGATANKMIKTMHPIMAGDNNMRPFTFLLPS